MNKTRRIVTLDAGRCKRCGLCIERFGDYCIFELNGLPAIDYRICNICQKCVAICPSQAILVNNTVPGKIESAIGVKSEDLLVLLATRRSIKIFKEKELSENTLRRIIDVAKYAPNQNKNIDIVVITRRELVDKIDTSALNFYSRLYRIMFSLKPVTYFLTLLSPSLFTIKKKMEYDLFTRKRIVKPGTQALILLVGNRRVPVTESSAQYLLSTMIIFAHSLGIGSCLMDSVKIALNWNSRDRKKLRIPRKSRVLGVLALGYSNEKIVNIPRGYMPRVQWNYGAEETGNGGSGNLDWSGGGK
jgi:nitroreductase/NAD-dependent dihydropyrimidine dehydrogenase PreA subunit